MANLYESLTKKTRTFRGINLLRIAKLKNYNRFISTRDRKDAIKKENNAAVQHSPGPGQSSQALILLLHVCRVNVNNAQL